MRSKHSNLCFNTMVLFEEINGYILWSHLLDYVFLFALDASLRVSN